MTKVKITCGGYGRNVPGTRVVKTARLGEVIEVEDEEALRLSRIGAAVILVKPVPVKTTAAGPDAAPADAEEGQEGNDKAEDTDAVEAPVGPDRADAVTVEDGHLTAESLMNMSKKDLLAMAADMGVKVNDKMSKATIATLISKEEIGYDEDAVTGLPVTGGSDIVA